MVDLLQIKLLGGFAVSLAGQPVMGFRSAKARALLAYLAAQPGREHLRPTLATLLWGDLPERAAKTNLRIELSNLHKALAHHPGLLITRNTVRLDLAAATVDVVDFQHELTSFLALPIETQQMALAQLTAAVDEYQGEFLRGFLVADAPEFDEWRMLTQEQLHEGAMNALTLLQQHYAEQGNWAALAEMAQRQLVLVPWQESAHRNLIGALAAQNQRTAALEQYARCVAVLQAELGVEPAPATQEIAARLRSNGASASPLLSPLARHNLPQSLKTMVGRRAEIEQVYTLVQQERLVTLLGIGGVGKSRLAQAVAQKALTDFADGVWFVSLTSIDATDNAADRIALAMAAAIGFPLTNVQRPLAELAAHLARKEMLFVLDNWDHLTPAADALCEALLATEAIHLLATSRVRLHVEGEILVPVTGLAREAAFALFVERARQQVPSFASEAQTPATAADIHTLCAQVGGLPLGIELAASWVEHFSVAEIAHSLAEMAVEPAQAEHYVSRHHTLEGVFEYSWRLLSALQQAILAQLSAFRGGFDRAAAAAITGSTLNDLSVLLAHSLVQRVGSGRYDLHPVVQEFTARKLAPAVASALFDAHSTYYLTLLIKSESAQHMALRVEFDNIHSAWQRATLAKNATLIGESAVVFGGFIYQFGIMADGNQRFAEAAARFDGHPQQAELVAQLLDQQAIFLRALAGLPAIYPLQQRVLTLTKNPKLLAQAHFDLANHHAEQGEWTKADLHFDQIEALTQASGDLGIYISAVEERVHLNALHFRGDFAQGIVRLEELVGLLDSTPTPIANAETLRFRLWQSLPLLATRQRDYALAIRYANRALAWAQQMGHRAKQCQVLVDVGLAEQFAGLYDEAVAHNQAALALAEAMGDADLVALLKANLCLTLRQPGRLAEALEYGLAAIESLRTLGNRRIEGQARNRVGHTLLALERWADAEQAYGDALTVWAPTQHPNRYEAVAGRAAALWHLARPAEALPLAETVLEFVAAHDLVGIVEPVLLLLNCATVFRGCDDEAQAHRALQHAAAWVQTVATRISDETVRTAFLARPDVGLLNTILVLK
jgi:DNA-binding SARP family transcriptional activator